MIKGNEDVKAYTAGNRQIYAWAAGAVTFHALIGVFGQITNIFILGFGLSPILVSWVMTLPRFLDGLIDPFLGHLSDNTRTRWGRRKPFMFVGAILAAVFVMAVWWVNRDWGTWGQFAYLLTCTTMFYICWGIFAMAWTAMGYELTDDYHERSRIQGIAGLFMTVVLLIISWIYWIALRPMFGKGEGTPYTQTGLAWVWEFIVRQFKDDPNVVADEVNGIRWISCVLAIAAVIGMLVVITFCKERFVNANVKKHVKLLPAIKATLTNRPFVIILAQRATALFGGRICGGVAGFLSIYYVCEGDKKLSMKVAAITGTMSMVLSFILMPFMRHFSKMMGKRNALLMSTGLAFVSAVIAPFITLPGHPYLPLIPALIILPLSIIGNTLGDALLPDICDYDELQYGERREGLFTAVLAFFSKMEMSMAALGIGYLITWTGYVKELPAQTEQTINRMWYLGLLPNIGFTLIGFLLILIFPMTEATTAEVRKQLDKRRAEETPPGNTV